MKHLTILSDGDTLGVRVRRDLVGTFLAEVPSYRREAGLILWLDGPMYLVWGAELVPISDPAYAYASSRDGAAELALAFFAASADAVIDRAESEGISPAECY